jgi:hypothetical protein
VAEALTAEEKSLEILRQASSDRTKIRRSHPQRPRSASRVTLPLEYYEAARDKKLIDFQAAAANILAA